MTIAFYPGSFNPITKGHEHIIRVASGLVDKLYVGVGVNADKKYDFTDDARVSMVDWSIKNMGLTNVEISFYNGLLFKAARDVGASIVIRGLRTISDFDYEFTLNDFNKTYDASLETLFLMAPKEFLTISSTNVRTAAKEGLPVEQWVNEYVAEELRKRFHRSL